MFVTALYQDSSVRQANNSNTQGALDDYNPFAQKPAGTTPAPGPTLPPVSFESLTHTEELFSHYILLADLLCSYELMLIAGCTL